MWRTEFEGRLGKDPEMRYIADGTPVTSFPVAVNFQEKGTTKTEWLNCSVWRDMAEDANQQLKKGDLVRMNGTVKTRLWEKEDGSFEKSIDVSVVAFANV
mgnify:FL=1